MALGFYSNWDAMEGLTSTLGQFYDPPSELVDALVGLYDPVDVPIDSLFDPQQPPSDNDLFTYIEPTQAANLLPSFSDPSIVSLSTEQYPLTEDFEFCRCPKRPRSCGDLHFPTDVMMGSNMHNAAPPPAEFASPPWPAAAAEEKKPNGGCLSAQSVAARERRKRISEKTQELGRLIPGGSKMNTAEMFQAASKYVKFLQAQIGILSLMGSMQNVKSPDELPDDLHLLLRSPVMQEKLAGEEKCIVPREMAEAMAKDSEIRSSPSISRDLDGFIESARSELMGR